MQLRNLLQKDNTHLMLITLILQKNVKMTQYKIKTKQTNCQPKTDKK